MSRNIVWLISYPRSGSTWMRLLLSNVLHPDIDCGYYDIDKYTPDMHQMKWSKIVEESEKNGYPFFVKSHFMFMGEYPNSKIIYIYRDGRDVALSCYYYYLWSGHVSESTSFRRFFHDKFIQGEIPHGKWRYHVEFWLNNNHGYRVAPVRYEDLLSDTFSEVKRILTFVGKNVDDKIIEQAVERTKFSKLKIRSQSEQVHEYKRGLSGGSGGWREQFTSDMNEVFWAQAGSIMEKLNYHKGVAT